MAFALMLIVKAQAVLGSVRSEDMEDAETTTAPKAPPSVGGTAPPTPTVRPAAELENVEKARHAL